MHHPQPTRGTNRFCTDQHVSVSMQAIHNSHYVTGHQNIGHIEQKLYRETFCDDGPRALTFIEGLKSFVGIDIEKKKVEEWSSKLETIVEKTIQTNDRQYWNACQLLYQYRTTRKVEHLLRLYTLETNFYRDLPKGAEKTESLATPIMYHLSTVSSRAFQGYCHRGLTMKEEDFEIYWWSLKNKKGCHLETNTFWSTSIDPIVAACFFGEGQRLEKGQLGIIMEFHFTYPCSTAIALFQSPSLSQFQDEEEVLILPGTVFQVTEIETGDDRSRRVVHLERLDTREEMQEMCDFVTQSRLDDFRDNFCNSYSTRSIVSFLKAEVNSPPRCVAAFLDVHWRQPV